MNRRNFVKKSAAGLAVAAVSPVVLAEAAQGAVPLLGVDAGIPNIARGFFAQLNGLQPIKMGTGVIEQLIGDYNYPSQKDIKAAIEAEIEKSRQQGLNRP